MSVTSNAFSSFCGSEDSQDNVDLNMKMLVDVWDDDFAPSLMRNDFIGYYELTIAEMLECAANKTAIMLKPPPLKHNQNPGKLYIDVAMLGFPKAPRARMPRAIGRTRLDPQQSRESFLRMVYGLPLARFKEACFRRRARLGALPPFSRLFRPLFAPRHQLPRPPELPPPPRAAAPR